MKNEVPTIPDNLSYEDIRVHFGTGQFVRDHSSQDKKAGHYRNGMMTKVGDIEQSQWIEVAERLIHEKGDWEMFLKLKTWYKTTTAFFRNEKELHVYSLECFVAGIHNSSEWVDYVDFNKKYRPELLSDLG